MGKKKESSKKISWFGRLKKRIIRTVTLIFVFFAGVFAGNLDRLDQRGMELLQYKQFIPRYLHIFLPGGRAEEAAGKAREELQGRIIEVYDGDTATLLSKDQSQKYKIRFYGIDAPEAKQEYGIASRDALRQKILGKEVRVHVVSVDRYGRCVSKIHLDSRYINLEMVQEGNAWYYSDYARNDMGFSQAEAAARKSAAGLWQFPSPQPPWEYRKARK